MYKFCSIILLLSLVGCGLFEKTPDSVVKGQRGVYQGIIVAEQNDEELLRQYEADNKAAVTYHINFIFEPKIEAIRKDPSLSREEKSLQITEIEKQRDGAISEAYAAIENKTSSMRDRIMKNHTINKKLVEAVYLYLSTTPIQIDNMEFWLEKLKEISNG